MLAQSRVREGVAVFDLSPTPSNVNLGMSHIKVGWQPPPTGWLKLNTDGSVKDTGKLAAYGDLLRNEFGGFVDGFSCNLGSCSIMPTELLGVWNGLMLAKDRGVDRIIIEVDSISVIHFIDNNCDLSHPCALIVHDILSLISQCHCADSLANHGHSISVGVWHFMQVPSFLSISLYADMSGTLFDKVTWLVLFVCLGFAPSIHKKKRD